MSKSTQSPMDMDISTTPLKPMPEHLYDAVVGSLRSTLGSNWGTPNEGIHAAIRGLRDAVQRMEGVYLAADPEHDDQHGVRAELWADHADLDTNVADDIVSGALRGLGDREILVLCRTFEDEGIHYQFASGTVDVGLVGTIVLIGPYARDVAQLARIGSGQPLGFNA